MSITILHEPQYTDGWSLHQSQIEDDEHQLLDRENRTAFEKECLGLSIFQNIWEARDYRRINSWLLGAGAMAKHEAAMEIYFLSNISFILEDMDDE